MSRTVQSNRALLASEFFGEDVKGTILLAMGATASMVWWPVEFCEALAEHGYRVIRFDHRDTGQSTTDAPGAVDYDLADLADDLGSMLDAYGVASAHLVGMSLGGFAAQLFALQHPERVKSLTLIASEPLGLTYESEGISEPFMRHFAGMETLDWSDQAAVAAFLLGVAELSAGSRPGFDSAAAEARIALELSRTQSMQSAFNHSMLAGALPDGLSAAGLTQAVLIIHGTEDPVISVHAAETASRAIPNARLLLLEGRGHELAPSDIGQISDAIVAFVAG